MRTEDVMKRLEAANPIDASDLANWPASDRGQEILRRVVSAGSKGPRGVEIGNGSRGLH